MRRPLPPLNALRAFEAAARYLSVTKAAEELHVTPAALSHQIKGLEDFLGLKLFYRRARAIALTDAGQLLYPGLHAAFIQVRQAVTTLSRRRWKAPAYCSPTSCSPTMTCVPADSWLRSISSSHLTGPSISYVP